MAGALRFEGGPDLAAQCKPVQCSQVWYQNSIVHELVIYTYFMHFMHHHVTLNSFYVIACITFMAWHGMPRYVMAQVPTVVAMVVVVAVLVLVLSVWYDVVHYTLSKD